MPVLTNAQIATLQKVIAITNNVLPRLEMLEALAAVNIGMKQRVAELRSQREYLAQLATAALEIERQLGAPITPTPVKQSGGVTYTPMPRAEPREYAGGVPLVQAPPPPTESTMTGGFAPTPLASTQRRFIRNAVTLDPAEQQLWQAQGWHLEYEPGIGWWAVKL